MKKILLLTGLVSFSLFTINAIGESLPLKSVNLTGTVEILSSPAPSVTKVSISPLNNNRVFQEFGVSSADYALALDINGAGLVELVPKSAGSGLPTIQVFALTATKGFVDTKGSFGDVFDNVTSTATGNLFEGFAGAITGRVSFHGPLSGPITVKKFLFSGIATGKSVGNITSADALIKFKVTTTTDFTQKP